MGRKGVKSVSEYLYNLWTKINLYATLYRIKHTHSIESLELLLTEKRAKYHKTYFHKYYLKNKRSSKKGSQKLEHIRATRKSSAETVVLGECVFSGEKDGGGGGGGGGVAKNVRKAETVSEITRNRGIPYKFSEF